VLRPSGRLVPEAVRGQRPIHLELDGVQAADRVPVVKRWLVQGYDDAMSLDAMVQRITDAATGDHTWLGSDEHLVVIQSFVETRSPDLAVRWIELGERSHIEVEEIAIEQPLLAAPLPAVDLRRLCRLHGAMVAHEVHHAMYGDQDPQMGKAMAAALRTEYSGHEELGHQLFNWLEDARLGTQVHHRCPEEDPYVSDLCRESLAQLERVYAVAHHEPPWSSSPLDEYAQLEVALAERIYAGDRGSVLSPRVAQVVADVGLLIERGTQASHTNDAREAALQTVDYLSTLPLDRALSGPVAVVGRNDPCPCGSGLKYKKCHGW
jgi:SEC-C motif